MFPITAIILGSGKIMRQEEAELHAVPEKQQIVSVGEGDAGGRD